MSDREDVYRLLEDKMLRASDYSHIEVEEEREPEQLVQVPRADGLTGNLIDERMKEYDGSKVLVRWGVLRRLRAASEFLLERDAGLQLEVCYGFRAMAVQEELYAGQRKALKAETGLTGMELDAAVHRRIASPTVAGHPTGGAVDVHVLRKGVPVPMGTKIWDFSTKDAYTFSPFITREEWFNRQLLRDVMLQAGFAPFDGEWWHFSYGDKEWARYYDKSHALYSQFATQAQDMDARKVG